MVSQDKVVYVVVVQSRVRGWEEKNIKKSAVTANRVVVSTFEALLFADTLQCVR